MFSVVEYFLFHMCHPCLSMHSFAQPMKLRKWCLIMLYNDEVKFLPKHPTQ